MCMNRALQRGLRKQIELFYCGEKGWGVKAAEDIAEGEFVIEYIGEVISEDEKERREENCEAAWSYTFTITTQNRLGERCYIDAHAIRNLAAFINFGCDPNLETKVHPL